MAEFAVRIRDVCSFFIDHGSDRLKILEFLKNNFPELVEHFEFIILNIQKSLVHSFKTRWNKSWRKKKEFLKINSKWLDTYYKLDLTCKTSGQQSSKSVNPNIGRPAKTFFTSSECTKRRNSTQLLQKFGFDQIRHAYLQSLRARNKHEDALIVEKLALSPTNVKDKICKLLLNENTSNIFSNDEIVALIADLGLSKFQYNLLREHTISKNSKIFPSYYQILNAKKYCYPEPDSMTVTLISASVKLQSLLDHTARRILEMKSVEELHHLHNCNLVLMSKWGCDGSSGQSQYKQILPGEQEGISDSHLFIASLVPLRLLVSNESQQILWQNQRPSSTRYCRPIIIEFTQETSEKTKSVVSHIEAQISNLNPTMINIQGKIIYVTHQLFFTMVDGKVCKTLTNTPSTSTCVVCLAKPKEMNDLSRVRVREEREETYKFGLSSLHAWIRFMELVLHISYNLSFTKWAATTPEQKIRKAAKKKNVQIRFRNEIGLIVDKPTQGSGNTNDGNTARRFFANSVLTADITGVNEVLIRRFSVILHTMACGRAINPEKFGKYCYETAEFYVDKYHWYYMPASVHKILIHGENIIKFAVLPIGQLSEDAQEARNKDYKNYRYYHARKCSREATNRDVFNRLLFTSDPYISSIRHQVDKPTLDLPEEAMELLM